MTFGRSLVLVMVLSVLAVPSVTFAFDGDDVQDLGPGQILDIF